jgi:zinc protease
MMKLNCWAALLGGAALANVASASIVEHIVRTQDAGVDVIAYPMGANDVITVRGSLPAGDSYAAAANIAAASITGFMLDKGTTRQNKFAIAKQLDDAGAQMAFNVGAQMVSVQARFLKKDLPLVVRLMAEELRTPAFSAEEFAKAKTQFEASVRENQQSTDQRADEALSRAIFPVGHPNRKHSAKEWLEAADKLTVEDLKAFHQKYYGPAYFTLVFVGDINASQIQQEVGKAFAGWAGGVGVVRTVSRDAVPAAHEEVVQVAGKESVSVSLGQSIGLRYQDPDTLALSVGTLILGSDFTSRLMSTVRNQEGLTYGIGAQILGDTFVDGSWAIEATFAPQLLDRGITSTQRELLKWWQGGVSAAELEARKTNVIGSYQVSLATTGGMASAILRTVNNGKPLTWLDEYRTAIQALTVDQVNTAIKKYLNPDHMVLIKAGSLASK